VGKIPSIFLHIGFFQSLIYLFMADVETFVKSPCHVLINKCTKDTLLKIAEYYEIKLSDKRIKESSIRTELKDKLIDKRILIAEMSKSGEHEQSLTAQSVLTFDQQKELLLLQMEHEKLKQKSEQGRIELEKAKKGSWQQVSPMQSSRGRRNPSKTDESHDKETKTGVY